MLMTVDVFPLKFLAMESTISKVVSDLTWKPPWNITGFNYLLYKGNQKYRLFDKNYQAAVN